MTREELRATATVPRGDGLHGWDWMAVELEYAELLYLLVRTLQPQSVVESGTGRGIATRFIAEGLRDNGRGSMITFEPDPVYLELARENLDGLSDIVLQLSGDTLNVVSDVDLLFLDSGPTRPAEIERWITGSGPRRYGTAVVHDANREEYNLPAGLRLTAGDGLWVSRAEESGTLVGEPGITAVE